MSVYNCYVANRHHLTSHPEYIKGTPIYGGRGTILGNQFKDKSRHENCVDYAEWFDKNIEFNQPLIDGVNVILNLLDYDDVTIICSCHPLECHLHKVAEYINSKKT